MFARSQFGDPLACVTAANQILGRSFDLARPGEGPGDQVYLVGDAMGRRSRITNVLAILFTTVLCLGIAPGWAQQEEKQKPEEKQKQEEKQKTDKQQKQSDKQQQQMQGLDEQIQEIKSDVLGISAELSRLEEKLLYPSGTQVAIFVALAKGDTMRLDAVKVLIDGQLATLYIYSFKELEALRKGGVQRIYVDNVATGDHQLE